MSQPLRQVGEAADASAASRSAREALTSFAAAVAAPAAVLGNDDMAGPKLVAAAVTATTAIVRAASDRAREICPVLEVTCGNVYADVMCPKNVDMGELWLLSSDIIS